VSSCFYRIAQESLNNIAKYAHAKDVTVELFHQEQELSLSIEDDGVGFDVKAVRGKARLGLVSMGERAMLIGARFSMESRIGYGTRVAVTVAYPHTDL
jgi:signal transduction histidine kinase